MRAVILLAFAALALASKLPVLLSNTEDAIPGQYIVVFKKLSPEVRNRHIQRVRQVGRLEAEPIVFDIANGTFAGYSVRPDARALDIIRSSPEVSYIEQDQVVRISQTCETQTEATWGIDRVSERTLFIDGNYKYPSTAGAGVTNFIIDTGIYVGHNDFGTRAVWGANYAGDNINDDCNGHGTHVAGTVAGTKFGVAKASNLVAVKVLNCGGSGSWTGVIQGLQYAANAHQSGTGSTANLSLGGGFIQSVNDATAATVTAGVVVVVAAGNNNGDACLTSPASTPSAITVAASELGEVDTQQVDVRSYFSNFGGCCDIIAPGSSITSDWIGSPTAENTISGTSMASPHVAGVAALILGGDASLDPKAVENIIKGNASPNIVVLNCASTVCDNTPNLLVYSPC